MSVTMGIQSTINRFMPKRHSQLDRVPYRKS